MKFSKLQATGNDFILVDSLTEQQECDWQELARIICHRHFGVGADGLIVVENSTIADLKMRIFNADGSEAEVSGNGLRCFAKYVVDRGLAPTQTLSRQPGRPRKGETQPGLHRRDSSLTVETLAGVRRVTAYLSAGKVKRAQVSMGFPRFQPEEIPVRVKIDRSVASEPLLNHAVTIEGKQLTLSFVSLGNPHAVNFSSQPVSHFPLAEIGPKVETHTMFPERANFEVARVLNQGKIEARVWERGVGETLACGSGACAIAAVAQLLGWVGRVVDIVLPGGTLSVSWDGVGEVLLTGPVEEVFVGEWHGGQG